MPKRKNTRLLLGYSDSEHEDEEDSAEDEQYKDSDSSGLNSQEMLDDNQETNGQKNDVKPELYFEDIYGDKNLSILEFHQSLFNKNANEIMVPPPTKISCPPELQAKIEGIYEKVQNGYDLNKMIQKRKSMRNPSIYEKMIHYLQIDEMGTNYPKDIYNPEPFLNSDSYYEELAKKQKDEMEKREKEKKESEKINSSKRASSSGFLVTEKKSKWDSTSSTSSSTSAAIAAALAAANKIKPLTNQSNSTKPTVISAFGTISKKK